jgi:hypothetical protein
MFKLMEVDFGEHGLIETLDWQEKLFSRKERLSKV